MWIERLDSQVQGRGPVICRDGHQQRSRMWDSGIGVLGNPARITPETGVNLPFKFVNGLLRFKNSETIEAGVPHPLMNS
jgi:hypothetical protein